MTLMLSRGLARAVHRFASHYGHTWPRAVDLPEEAVDLFELYADVDRWVEAEIEAGYMRPEAGGCGILGPRIVCEPWGVAYEHETTTRRLRVRMHSITDAETRIEVRVFRPSGEVARFEGEVIDHPDEPLRGHPGPVSNFDDLHERHVAAVCEAWYAIAPSDAPEPQVRGRVLPDNAG